MPAAPEAGAPPKPEAKSGKVHFTTEQLALLQLGAFSTSIFDFHISDYDRYTEIEWFCEQIQDVRKVFEEPMAKELAHQAVLNALQLRRINDKLVTMQADSKEYNSLQNSKANLEESFRKQWEQIMELCPTAVQAASQKAILSNLSDIISRYQKWKTDPNNRARDGIFTDDELQVMFRVSVQKPEPDYRLGWVLACNEAKLGLFDPQWKRRMSLPMCKAADASFKYALTTMMEQLGIHKPDLEAEGPAGEYDPIHTEADGPITDATFDGAADAPPTDTVEIA
jgi:hypothetical protein